MELVKTKERLDELFKHGELSKGTYQTGLVGIKQGKSVWVCYPESDHVVDVVKTITELNKNG